MSQIVVDSLKQKFELRTFKVLFDINDSLIAEEMVDSLDRGSAIFRMVFNLQEEPKAEIFLLTAEAELEKIGGGQPRVGEVFRLLYNEGVIGMVVSKLTPNYGEIALRELGHLVFNQHVGEREVRIRQWRTPSWLREGFALQAAWKIRKDSKDFLQKGWAILQKAQAANQLIQPAVMRKDINLIPDPTRRELALYQSFYMVRLLLTIYCDSFFNKYSTLMSALDDMESETCFRQITSFDFEKFFGLFENWVQKTNAWTAME
jgi:hypothetical protein